MPRSIVSTPPEPRESVERYSTTPHAHRYEETFVGGKLQEPVLCILCAHPRDCEICR